MDFITDESCRHLKRLDSLTSVPDFVKNSSVDAEATRALNRKQFADPLHREFPIDEPGHVYLSYAYLKSAALQAPVIEQRVKRAAILLGIAPELEKLDQIFAQSEKKAAAPEPRYALTILDDSEGQPDAAVARNYYPLNTPDQVKASAIQLGNDTHRVPLILFGAASREIVKAASGMGLGRTDLPERIWRYGEERLMDVEHVKFACEMRRKLTGDEVYEDLAKSAAEEDIHPDAFVDLLLQADVQNNLRYDLRVSDPWLTIYSGPTAKEASKAIEGLVLVAGAPVPMEKIAAVAPAELQKLYPAAAADKLVELVKKAATTSQGIDLDPLIAVLDLPIQRSFLALLVQRD